VGADQLVHFYIRWLWLKDCLVCFKCKKNLKNESIHNVNEQPVCVSCVDSFRI